MERQSECRHARPVCTVDTLVRSRTNLGIASPHVKEAETGLVRFRKPEKKLIDIWSAACAYSTTACASVRSYIAALTRRMVTFKMALSSQSITRLTLNEFCKGSRYIHSFDSSMVRPTEAAATSTCRGPLSRPNRPGRERGAACHDQSHCTTRYHVVYEVSIRFGRRLPH